MPYANPNVRGGNADGSGGYVDPLADFGDFLFSRWGAGAILGVDLAFGGGELIGSAWDLGGTVATGVGESLSGLAGG